MSTDKPAPALAFVAALHDEVAPAIDRLHLSPVDAPYEILAFRPQAGGGPLVVITGWGAEAASAGARWLVNELRPAAVVSVGYAGGTRAGTGPGTLALATSVVRIRRVDAPSPEAEQPVDPALFATARAAASGSGFPLIEGVCATTPTIVETASGKSAIGLSTPVVAVDLETWHTAKVACDAKIPFLAARGIVDTVEMELPGFVSKLPPGPKPGAAGPALRHVARHPASVVGVVRTGLAASKARRATASFMEKLSAAWSRQSGSAG